MKSDVLIGNTKKDNLTAWGTLPTNEDTLAEAIDKVCPNANVHKY